MFNENQHVAKMPGYGVVSGLTACPPAGPQTQTERVLGVLGDVETAVGRIVARVEALSGPIVWSPSEKAVGGGGLIGVAGDRLTTLASTLQTVAVVLERL